MFVWFVIVVCMTRGVMEIQFRKYNFDVAGIIHEATTNTIADTKPGIPAQAICNRLNDFEPPPVIKNLNRLEQISIARRKLFQNVTIMVKCQIPKLLGAKCIIPIDTLDISKVFPHGTDS